MPSNPCILDHVARRHIGAQIGAHRGACKLISWSSLMLLSSEWMVIILIFKNYMRNILWNLIFVSLSLVCRRRCDFGALGHWIVFLNDSSGGLSCLLWGSYSSLIHRSDHGDFLRKIPHVFAKPRLPLASTIAALKGSTKSLLMQEACNVATKYYGSSQRVFMVVSLPMEVVISAYRLHLIAIFHYIENAPFRIDFYVARSIQNCICLVTVLA